MKSSYNTVYIDTDIRRKCESHFEKIYGEEHVEECMERLRDLIDAYQLEVQKPIDPEQLWTHKDQILITYADMVKSDADEETSHLAKQHQFLRDELLDSFSTVHILPFFPSSSDDGFSVIDYREVDEEYGDWEDIINMAPDFRLMADMVLNHISRKSEWFQKYLKGQEPYDSYFLTVDPKIDLSGVTRPRSSPMLTPVQTAQGERLVWTTFSEDQKDVNFKDPRVLFEFLDILFFYVVRGIKVIRLDAVAYIWKEIGSSCIHLPQTHEIVKLFRTLVDYYMPDVTLVTETNVPHKENISYFGDGDEAHMVYQFSLPPLLLHALLTENSNYLTTWLESLSPLPKGCTYLNFTSSHDGIGMRPLEGLVPKEEFLSLVERMKELGGFVSYKQNPDRTVSPYELNITYYDALTSKNGFAGLKEKRFLCSQTIMLSLQGVPGIYFHNLTGTRNYLEGVKMTGRYRSINRKKWTYSELEEQLGKETTTQRIFNEYKHLMKVRNEHPAFHPFGGQRVFDLGKDLLVIEREAPDGSERILVVSNVTLKEKEVDLMAEGLPVERDEEYENLLTGQTVIRNGRIRIQPYDTVWVVV